MEQRNEALKETGEQTRKQLKELIEEKAKLANELNEAHVSLSDADRKYSALNRTSISLKSELQSTQVTLLGCLLCTDCVCAVGRTGGGEEGTGCSACS